MKSKIPGTPPLKYHLLQAVARCPGLIAADYSRRLNVEYQTTARALHLMAQAGVLRKARITDPESLHYGKLGYFLP